GSFHGVFVAAGPQPTDAELAGARRQLEEFQRRLVAAADLEWERTKNPMFITDLERRAARQLGVEKPWLYDPKPMAECPVCAGKHGPKIKRAALFRTALKSTCISARWPSELSGSVLVIS